MPVGAIPCVLEMRRASRRLDLEPRAGGFLLGSYAAEKLEEWKQSDQMARDGQLQTGLRKPAFPACLCTCATV